MVTLCCGFERLPPAPPSGFTDDRDSNFLIPSLSKYSTIQGFFQSVHQLSKIPLSPYKSAGSIVSKTIGSSKSSENKKVSPAMILGNKFELPDEKQVTFKTVFTLMLIGPVTSGELIVGFDPFVVYRKIPFEIELFITETEIGP